LWLRLVEVGGNPNLVSERERLEVEAKELKLILAAIAARDDTGQPG